MNRYEQYILNHLERFSVQKYKRFREDLPCFRRWLKIEEPPSPWFLSLYSELAPQVASDAKDKLRHLHRERAELLWLCGWVGLFVTEVDTGKGRKELMPPPYNWPEYWLDYYNGRLRLSDFWEGAERAMSGDDNPEEKCWNCGGWTDDPEGLCQGCATGDDGGDYPDPDPDDDDFYDGWDPSEGY